MKTSVAFQKDSSKSRGACGDNQAPYVLASPSTDHVPIGFGAKVGACAFVKSCIAIKVIFFDLIVSRIGLRCLIITLALKSLA